MRIQFISFLTVIASLFGLSSATAGEVWLTLDQVRSYELPEPVSSIVIGNPAIADIEVESNTHIMLYGRAPGLTNIYFFNLKGERMDNVFVRVQTQTSNMLVLQRGVSRATYSCTTNCDAAISVSDSVESIRENAQKIQQKAAVGGQTGG